MMEQTVILVWAWLVYLLIPHEHQGVGSEEPALLISISVLSLITWTGSLAKTNRRDFQYKKLF